MYLVVFTKDKNNIENFNSKDETNEILETMSSSMENFSLLDSSKTIINELEQNRFIFSASTDNLKITYYFVTIEGLNNFYNLISWTLTDSFESNIEFFKKSMNTFREN